MSALKIKRQTPFFNVSTILADHSGSTLRISLVAAHQLVKTAADISDLSDCPWQPIEQSFLQLQTDLVAYFLPGVCHQHRCLAELV